MSLFLPLLLMGFGILFLIGGKRCTAAFSRGAKEGLTSAAALFPTLLLFVISVSVFRASGALALLSEALGGLCSAGSIGPSLLPLLLIRPVSGSASTAVLSDILTAEGPDSPIGMTASVLCGASETVLYVLSVYTAGTPLSGTRYLLPAALCTGLFVTLLSLAVSAVLYTG